MTYRVREHLIWAISLADFLTNTLYCVIWFTCFVHKHKAVQKPAAQPGFTGFSFGDWDCFSPPLTFLSRLRSTMFPANLLLLMVLLLPQASSGRQGGDTSEIDHGRASPTPSPHPSSLPSLLDPSLAHTIQALLLRRLGLQSQPNPRPGVAVPQYLLDLYRFHQQQYHLVEDPLFSFPSQHIQQANTVRSFHHNGKFTESCWYSFTHSLWPI